MRWLMVVMAACGGGTGAGGDGGPGSGLTCEVLNDAANCWATAAAALEACLPVNTEMGALAGDRASCSFSTGAKVTFDPPLPTFQSDLRQFTWTLVGPNGVTCGSYTDTFMNRLIVEAGGKHVEASVDLADSVMTLACDGGPTLSVAIDTLSQCHPLYSPTDAVYTVGPGIVAFTITAVGVPSPLFDCVP